MEPSCAEAIGRVIDNPDWLDLSDRTVVVLGAAAEMGPLRTLLRWGADVAAVDLPRADLWERLIGETRRSAGSITVPVRRGDTPLAQRAGGDLRARPRRRDPVGRAPRGAARPRQLRLCRRGHQRAGLGRRRRPERRACSRPAGRTTWHWPSSPPRPTSSPCRGRPSHARSANYAERRTSKVLRVPAAHALRGTAAAAQLRALRGPDARASTTASSCSRGPTTSSPSGSSGGGRRRTAHEGARVAQGRAADAHPLRRQEPRAGRGVCRRAPLRHRGLRARHRQHADGGTPRPRPAHRVARRSRTPGRTRRMPRCTVGCGPRPTTRAAPSGSPPCSAWPPRSEPVGARDPDEAVTPVSV